MTSAKKNSPYDWRAATIRKPTSWAHHTRRRCRRLSQFPCQGKCRRSNPGGLHGEDRMAEQTHVCVRKRGEVGHLFGAPPPPPLRRPVAWRR